MGLKVAIILSVFVIALIVLYLLYRWETIPPPQPKYTPVATQSWGPVETLGDCKLYNFPPEKNSAGLWTVNKTYNVGDRTGESVPTCIQNTQLVLRPIRRKCLNGQCKLPDGTYAEIWDSYETCSVPNCKNIQASLSLSIPNQCSDINRLCIEPNLLLGSCNPQVDLFQLTWVNNQLKFYLPNYGYLASQNSTLYYSSSEYLWNISTIGGVTRVSDPATGYILGSTGGVSVSLYPADIVRWSSFQYLELPIYNVLLKQADCPCKQCIAITGYE